MVSLQALLGADGLPAELLAVVVAMYCMAFKFVRPVGKERYSFVAAAAFTINEGCVVPRVTDPDS